VGLDFEFTEEQRMFQDMIVDFGRRRKKRTFSLGALSQVGGDGSFGDCFS